MKFYIPSLLLLLLMLAFACGQTPAEVPDMSEPTDPGSAAPAAGLDLPLPPNELYGSLFRRVQMERVFPDGKTFVDCIPKVDPDSIMRAYALQKGTSDFDLPAFVSAHFDLPPEPAGGFEADPSLQVSAHIESLWPVLTRQADEEAELPSSLIALPHDYIVPGGRFREVYYWDSYFTMLGLVAHDRLDMVEQMVDNFAYLIETVGFIPNGNRSYYLTRSQPPFFTMMVALLADHVDDAEQVWAKYLPALEAEYQWWMEGRDRLSPTHRAELHCVRMPDGSVLNRYYDRGDYPRAESYREDVETIGEAVDQGRDSATVARHLRSGAESGWDYSSRWLADGRHLWTIETTDIVPPDLNALLLEAEFNLEIAHRLAGDHQAADRYDSLFDVRMAALHQYCYNESNGLFEDYHWPDDRFTGRLSLATVFPLAVVGATDEQAQRVADYLQTHFLKPGGLPATLQETGQQWDAPNGWPPLQYMAVLGLYEYEHDQLARQISERWVANNERVFDNVHKMVEKYNVYDLSLAAGGGEYPVQDGFGWSNGVYMAFRQNLAAHE